MTWTGGQYSLYRALLGAYLGVHFAHLVPWGAELFSHQGAVPDGALSPLFALFPSVLRLADGPAVVTGLLVLATAASLLLLVGKADRIAALFLWYVLACLYGRNPLISNPGLPYVGLLLVIHAALPPAPYGSLAARGRVDPGGGWRMDPRLWAVAWILMAVGYSYSGYTKLVSPSWRDGSALAYVLSNPLARPDGVVVWLRELPEVVLQLATWGALGAELLFAPLALVRRLRPWLWASLLGMHLTLILVIDFADLSLGMVMLHLFTFDPGWVKPRRGAAALQVFYDGHCGLCQNSVRLLIAEDPPGEAFRFAPLQGSTFAAAVPEAQRAALPDSLVIRDDDGALHVRSNGVIVLLRALGGAWRVLGTVLAVVPRPLRDLGYRVLAGSRRRLFGTREESCPLLPPELQARFEP